MPARRYKHFPFEQWGGVTAHLQSLNLSSCTSTEIPVTTTDRAALVALYNASDGANWNQNDNWLSNEPLSTWHGVSTDASGRVTKLRIISNKMTGEISNLSALTELTELILT